jgi:hypothetical protein
VGEALYGVFFVNKFLRIGLIAGIFSCGSFCVFAAEQSTEDLIRAEFVLITLINDEGVSSVLDGLESEQSTGPEKLEILASLREVCTTNEIKLTDLLYHGYVPNFLENVLQSIAETGVFSLNNERMAHFSKKSPFTIQ